MLQQAYGEECLSQTQYHKWYQHFKTGRTSIEEHPKFGRPSMSMDDNHVEKLLAVIHQNRCLTVHEVAEEVGICKSWCHLILTGNCRCVVLPQNLCRVCWQMHSLSMNFWQSMRWMLSPQPPYFPDLAPEDLFLFLKLKSSLKGHWFPKVEEIQENSLWDLRAILQNTFQDAFQNWKKCWERCIKSGGEYFEGDKFKL